MHPTTKTLHFSLPPAPLAPFLKYRYPFEDLSARDRTKFLEDLFGTVSYQNVGHLYVPAGRFGNFGFAEPCYQATLCRIAATYQHVLNNFDSIAATITFANHDQAPAKFKEWIRSLVDAYSSSPAGKMERLAAYFLLMVDNIPLRNLPNALMTLAAKYPGRFPTIEDCHMERDVYSLVYDLLKDDAYPKVMKKVEELKTYMDSTVPSLVDVSPPENNPAKSKKYTWTPEQEALLLDAAKNLNPTRGSSLKLIAALHAIKPLNGLETLRCKAYDLFVRKGRVQKSNPALYEEILGITRVFSLDHALEEASKVQTYFVQPKAPVVFPPATIPLVIPPVTTKAPNSPTSEWKAPEGVTPAFDLTPPSQDTLTPSQDLTVKEILRPAEEMYKAKSPLPYLSYKDVSFSPQEGFLLKTTPVREMVFNDRSFQTFLAVFPEYHAKMQECLKERDQVKQQKVQAAEMFAKLTWSV